jgi:hypothetical protein
MESRFCRCNAVELPPITIILSCLFCHLFLPYPYVHACIRTVLRICTLHRKRAETSGTQVAGAAARAEGPTPR